MSERKIIQIELSKKGFPCIWETGGGKSNTGEATIIASPDGSSKTAIYIRRSGHLSNQNHALVPVKQGDVVIYAQHHREDFKIYVYAIDRIDNNALRAELVKIHEFSNGEWDNDPPAHLNAAISAAMNKSMHYHCRIPYYVSNKNN